MTDSITHEFVRVDENHNVEFAPKILRVYVEGQNGELSPKTVLHPTKEDYASASPPYFPVIDREKPEIQPGYEITLDHYEERTEEGETVVVPVFITNAIDPSSDPSVEHALKQYDNAMEQYLKSVRDERGYTTREPSDYAFSQNERWHQDALDWIAFRDNVMEYALSVMNDFKSNGIVVSIDEFINGMPAMSWTIE